MDNPILHGWQLADVVVSMVSINKVGPIYYLA